MTVRHATAPAVVAGLGAFTTLAVYLAVIHSEDEPGQLTSGRVVLIAVWLATAGALALAAPFMPSPTTRAAMLYVAGFAMVPLVVLGAFSIGALLLIPAVCALYAAGASRPRTEGAGTRRTSRGRSSRASSGRAP